MSSRKKMMRELRKLKERVDGFKISQEVKVENSMEFPASSLQKQRKDPVSLTTGPMLRNSEVNALLVKILNNSIAIHKIRIILFNLESNPKQIVSERDVTILPQCSVHEIFAIGLKSLDLQEFEVVLEFPSGDVQNISTIVVGTDGIGGSLVPGCYIRNGELLPIVEERISSEW